MNSYKIEWQIETLSKNSFIEDGDSVGFELDDIQFNHWDFSHRDGWVSNRWITKAEIAAENFKEALNIFYHKLGGIIPKISFISQCYVSFEDQPFVVHKVDSDFIFFRNTYKGMDSGLMFRENELEALKLLMKKKAIPAGFFLYWKDLVNTTGYSSKLVLMFCAIESLINERDATGRSIKNWKKLERIIGKKLKKELWGEHNNSNAALRHRLIHGEYFSKEDAKNYVKLIHRKMISYFNNIIFRKRLVNNEVRHPQRHVLPKTKTETNHFLKRTSKALSFGLKELIDSTDSDNHRLDTKKYEECDIAQLKDY